MSNKVVIAGNGSSILKINYNRLPDDFDTFRCNQFYFEDKYYLGKRVSIAFFISEIFFEQYYTALMLNSNQEYEIQNIFCANLGIDSLQKHFINTFNEFFPAAQLGYKYIKQNLKEIDIFMKFNEIYKQQRVTSGTYMCAIATALGYKEIYLAGIDLYQNGYQYAFNKQQPNIIKLVPEFSHYNKPNGSLHTKEIDIQMLQILQNNYGINIFSICDDSPITKYIPLAPKNKQNKIKIENKPSNYTNDILIPNQQSYQKMIWSKTQTIAITQQ